MRRNFSQLATHQVERAFHQIVQGLPARALCGEFVDQPDQHGHHQKADKQQEIKLHKQLFHWIAPLNQSIKNLALLRQPCVDNHITTGAKKVDDTLSSKTEGAK